MSYSAIISRMPGKRVRYGGVKKRMADGSEGKRMRCIKGARHAHAAIRASGRVPGEEGRAAIQANRRIRAERERKDRLYGSAWRKGWTNLDGI